MRLKGIKYLLAIGCLFIGLAGFGQSLKKKLYGDYEGIVPNYKMTIGPDVIDVQQATIRISFDESKITQQIGNVSKSGTWRVYFEGKTYYILSVRLEGQLLEERITVYKKGKKITREGLFPQPPADLTKV